MADNYHDKHLKKIGKGLSFRVCNMGVRREDWKKVAELVE